jgi:hypothetical protein
LPANPNAGQEGPSGPVVRNKDAIPPVSSIKIAFDGPPPVARHAERSPPGLSKGPVGESGFGKSPFVRGGNHYSRPRA